MKNDVHNFLCCIFILMLTTQTKSQDIHFSPFFKNPILYTPPLAGTLAGIFVGNLNFQSGYKTKWQTINKPNEMVSLNEKYKIASAKNHHCSVLSQQILYDISPTNERTTTPIFRFSNYHQSANTDQRGYTLYDGINPSHLSAVNNGEFIFESNILYQKYIIKKIMEKRPTQRRI